jgi:hypothetical protein
MSFYPSLYPQHFSKFSLKLNINTDVYRKETLEKELDMLEADIKKLAARGPVYVSSS